jgi:8-oxo-dGTP pyrophosphatase MutT (NUDIX family)
MNSTPFVHNLIICSNVLIHKDGKYLLSKRSPNKKYAPNFIHPFGGKIDKDENPYVGARREIKEELGIEIHNLKLEAVVLEIKPDDKRDENWLVFYFSADYKNGDVKITEEGEVVYLTPDEIKNSKLFPSVRSIINNILNSNDGTVFTTNSYQGFESGIKELSKNVCMLNN